MDIQRVEKLLEEWKRLIDISEFIKQNFTYFRNIDFEKDLNIIGYINTSNLLAIQIFTIRFYEIIFANQSSHKNEYSFIKDLGVDYSEVPFQRILSTYRNHYAHIKIGPIEEKDRLSVEEILGYFHNAELLLIEKVKEYFHSIEENFKEKRENAEFIYRSAFTSNS